MAPRESPSCKNMEKKKPAEGSAALPPHLREPTPTTKPRVVPAGSWGALKDHSQNCLERGKKISLIAKILQVLLLFFLSFFVPLLSFDTMQQPPALKFGRD